MTDTKETRALEYYILSDDLYFRPNKQGYTGIRDNAGLYSLEVAESYIEAIAIHKDEAPEFTKACYEDLKINHLQSKILKLQTALQSQVEKDKALEYWKDLATKAVSDALGNAEQTRVMELMAEALRCSYDAQEYPADGSSLQEKALAEYEKIKGSDE